MIKAKVIDILKYLSVEEIKKFSDFLHSPYFNTKDSIVKLFEAYKEFYPDYDNNVLSKEYIFEKIYPEKKYNDEVFRNLNSDLFLAAKNFLSVNNFYSDEFNLKKHLLFELNRKKLTSLFDKCFDETKTIIENYSHRDTRYFFDAFTLYCEKSTNNSSKIKFSNEDIEESELNFIRFFIMIILDFQTLTVYHKRMLELDFTSLLDDDDVDEIFKKFSKKLSNLPQLLIYYYTFKVEATYDLKYYKKLKKLLFEFGNLLEKDNLYNKFHTLQHYIQKTKPPNDLETISELFEIRNEMLEKNIFPDNFFSHTIFYNQVKSGILLHKYDWAENFIKNYSHIIFSDYRESTINLSLALLCFWKKEYEQSLSHLAEVKYKDNFYILQIKNITSYIYYEKNDFPALINLLNSYKMYIIKNKELLESEFIYHNLFINFLNKLIKIKEHQKYHKLHKLLEEVTKCEFRGKIWMLEKIKELEEKEKRSFKTKLGFKLNE
ncbi:MAG: hypothetical protein M3R36_05095 [Bacteroidota bacterium]|nr:hypothetical protein [Bacteroidota bacterium]